MPIRPATEGASAFDIGKLLSDHRPDHARPRLRQHGGRAPPRSPTSTATRASCATAATRSTSWPSSSHVPGDQLPADLRRAAHQDRARRLHQQDQPAHAAARGPEARSSTASRATRTRCRCCRQRVSARCRPSTRTASTRSTTTHVELSTVRLLAKLPTIAAYAYKKSIGQPFLYPDNSLSLVENFLRMTFGFPAEPYEVDPDVRQGAGHAADPARRPRAELLDLHGAPGRLVRRPTCSPRSRPASTRCSGPLHGGANQAVLEMLQKIQNEENGDVEAFVKRVKNKEDKGARLMGFGHRVYKNYDPRAKIVKQSADEILRSSASPTRCSTSPRRWRRRRWPTTTSSSASSTRTSTSTPA